jgi:peptide deformylase
VLFIDRLDAKARKEAMKAIRATDWYEAGMTVKVSPHASSGKAG